MLWTIIVILIILWLLGFLGSNISSTLPENGQLDSRSDRHRRHTHYLAAPWGGEISSAVDPRLIFARPP